VWGIPGDGIKEKNGVRFIPTRVGNTPRKTSSISIQFGSSPRVWGILRLSLAIRASRTVHPHACGEYDHRGLLFGYGDRFIPRVWGILRLSLAIRASRTVHPHACGEYDHRGLLFGYGDRFIPTRVGNTAPTMLVMVANAGSSPACGEYWAQERDAARELGSSPRVWGIRQAGENLR